MLEGACHCGAVRWQYDGLPDGATACNCTVCRRGETRSYRRGQAIDFHFCSVCGCMAFYRALKPAADGRRKIAVNVRLSEPETVADIPIDHFDGLDKFDDLPRDGRRVRDYWF
jgi:hypothetical protein